MPPITRILMVTHVVCRYRLIALLPAHPLRTLLLTLSFRGCLLDDPRTRSEALRARDAQTRWQMAPSCPSS